MNELKKQLKELESKIPMRELISPEVSKSNIGWHIEHTLLTIDAIIHELKKSDPMNYKWSLRLPRLIVFTINKIPRGRAKSPEVVVPRIYDEITLNKHLKDVKLKIEELENISSDKYFDHPVFGNLKSGKTIKFIKIHTNHHLEIINDILKSKT